MANTKGALDRLRALREDVEARGAGSATNADLVEAIKATLDALADLRAELDDARRPRGKASAR